MSSSIQTYVIVPKDFDFEKHLSIAEMGGINIDIETARKVLVEVKKSGVHCQDFDFNSDLESGFDFSVRLLRELNMVIHEYENGSCSGGDFIHNIRKAIIDKKELIQQIF